MNVSYALRLFCICSATFFLVNALLSFALKFVSGAAIRIAERMRPRSASHFLLGVRLLPFALGAGAVLGLCIPSYLMLEPQTTAERASWAFLIFAFLGVLVCTLSVARSARAVAVSNRRNRKWLRAGREARLAGDDSNAVIVKKEAPLLALAGVYRPRFMVSEGVFRALSAEQLDVALRHERAHRGSRDNLKRLFLLLAPDGIPFVASFTLLDRAWSKFSEWAADDEAVQGDSRRALSLAEALLRVARMGAGPRLSYLHTSLVAADQDLSARVYRLLRLEPTRFESLRWRSVAAQGAVLAMSGSLATLMLWPATLSSVHRLLELFLR
jgi:beta-lactamase regulating signal transducer with metallopeptidase domain